MKITPLYVLTILLLTSCIVNFKENNEKSIYGTWRLYDIEQLNKDSQFEDPFSKAASLKKLVKEGSIICFFENGEYSEIKGDSKFKSGKWKLNDDKKSIQFIDSGQATDPLSLAIETNLNGKKVLTFSFFKKNINIKFIKESDKLPDFTSDPFYPANNLWRQKPQNPENSAQLTNRLTNYFKHIALILKAAKERNQDIVSFEYSKGPIKIYNGGIGIYPYNIVPDNWKNSFYDEADASTAYLKYEEYLTKSRYRGAGTGNWVEDDYNILLSIYADISEPNEK